MVSTTDVSAPLCVVDFHTEAELYSAKGTFSPTSELVSVSTQKDLNSVAGSWNLELVGHTWYDRLTPMDLVVIQMGRPPAKLDTAMVGVISDIRRSRTVGGNGEVRRVTKVSGQDLGKFLVKAVIKWFPQFSSKEFPIEQLGDVGSLLQMLTFYTDTEYQIGTPTALIKNTLKNILHILMSFEVKYWRNNAIQTASLKELMQYRLGKTENVIPFQTTMSSYEGSLWNYMTSVQGRPFNELFIDARSDLAEVVASAEATSSGVGKFIATFGEDNAQVALFFRQTPFDKGDWDKLRTHVVLDKNVISEDLGRSDTENFNMFLARPSLTVLQEDYGKMVKPLFNADNIKRYGISYLEVAVEGVGQNETLADNELKMGKQLTEKLKTWFENNVNYESGTITMKGNAAVHIGQRVLLDAVGRTYYVEGVAHSFQAFGSWQTMLNLTRGQKTTTAATVTSPAAAVKQPEPLYHVVKHGDSLWEIAERYYGDGKRFVEIRDANPQVKSDNLIYTGQRLLIPNPIRR